MQKLKGSRDSFGQITIQKSQDAGGRKTVSIGVILGFIVLALLLILGVPICVALGLGSACLMLINGIPLVSVGQVPFTALNSFVFLAIPLFILTGDVISASGMAKQLIRLSYAMFGWARGGLGAATLVGCGFFAAISGSNGATAAAMGRIMIPEMEEKYTKPYAAAIVATGGCLGIIIPPSLILIIYGATAGVSVGSLFMAGIVPGILMIICMMVANYLMCKKYNYDPPAGKFSFKELGSAIWDAKYALAAPIIILGSIYGGIATPTESAVIAVTYCFIASFLQRSLTLKDVPKLFVRSGMTCGTILPIVATAILLSQIMTMFKVPEYFTNMILSVSDSKAVLMFLMFVILFIAGMIMDTTPVILVLVPLFSPIVGVLGIDPVHWGICMVTTLTVGFVTPPIGVNLFVVSSIADISIVHLAKKSIPLIIAMCVSLILIYVFPQLTLFIPSFSK